MTELVPKVRRCAKDMHFCRGSKQLHEGCSSATQHCATTIPIRRTAQRCKDRKREMPRSSSKLSTEDAPLNVTRYVVDQWQP